MVQAEVVLASGEVVVADRDGEYADLFAGLSGSYGSFGIVTGVWLRLGTLALLSWHCCLGRWYRWFGCSSGSSCSSSRVGSSRSRVVVGYTV